MSTQNIPRKFIKDWAKEMILDAIDKMVDEQTANEEVEADDREALKKQRQRVRDLFFG